VSEEGLRKYRAHVSQSDDRHGSILGRARVRFAIVAGRRNTRSEGNARKQYQTA
jgi:hypothetical protein